MNNQLSIVASIVLSRVPGSSQIPAHEHLRCRVVRLNQVENLMSRTREIVLHRTLQCLQKTAFLSHLYIKTIILPRQARDKHRENSNCRKSSAITLSSGSVFLMDVNDDLPRQARDEHNSTVENREGFQRCVLLSPHIIQHHCHELESSLACPGEFDSDGGDVWIACKPPQLFLLEYSHCCKQE
jgi:hypothetical protein